MSLLGKALERPDLVRSLVQRLRTTGVASVVSTVRAKLDRAMPLGYSAAGEILEVGEGRREFQVGQRVACAGMGYASHAERIWVPGNLCVPIPDNVDYDSAAFVALGSIALQGVRVAEAKIGEHVAVLGLGLVGLVTAQILQAAGCTVWGVDPDPDRVALARELGVAFATSNSMFISESDLPRAGGRGRGHHHCGDEIQPAHRPGRADRSRPGGGGCRRGRARGCAPRALLPEGIAGAVLALVRSRPL